MWGLSDKGSTPALQAGRKGSIPLASTNTSQVVGQNLARLIIFAKTGATPVPETNLVFAGRANLIFYLKPEGLNVKVMQSGNHIGLKNRWHYCRMGSTPIFHTINRSVVLIGKMLVSKTMRFLFESEHSCHYGCLAELAECVGL